VSSSKAVVASCHANKFKKKENLVSLLAWIWRLEQLAEEFRCMSCQQNHAADRIRQMCDE